jgi:hypothetical protein
VPKAFEKLLKKEAKIKFPHNEKRQNAYVYGTLRKIGWTPKRR